jgi:hypothetical protein
MALRRRIRQLCLRTTVLQVRALEHDLAAAERKEIAAVDLDSLAVDRRPREDPFRGAAIARRVSGVPRRLLEGVSKSVKLELLEGRKYPSSDISLRYAPRAA